MPDKMHESIVGKRSIKTRGFRSPWGRKTINGLGDCKFRYWVNAECFPLYVMTKGSKTVEFECLLFFCLRSFLVTEHVPCTQMFIGFFGVLMARLLL